MDKHIQTMSIDERRVTTKLMKALENVPLENSNPEKFIRIGTSMEMKTKQDLVHFLKKSMDVFAWSYQDMPGIDPSVITHCLNVYPSSKPVAQKKRVLLSNKIMLLKRKSKS